MKLEEMPISLQEELKDMTPDMGLGGENDDMSNCPQQ
jgi:hypothetical protein